MRRISELLARRDALPPEPPGLDARLTQALKDAHPPVELPAGLGERIERAALRPSAQPVRARRSRLLVPAAAAAMMLLAGILWQTPALRAYQIAARMREAWETVRDLRGEGTCTVPVLGKRGSFSVRLWFRRPGAARADFASHKLRGTFLTRDGEARIRIPALNCDVLVPLDGNPAFLRDVAAIGRSLRRLEEMKELRLIGQERVAGQACYVLRFRTESLLERLRYALGLDTQTRREIARVMAWGKVWVSQANLLPMKVESYDPDGALILTAQFRSAAVNQGVDARVFALPGKAKAERLRARTFQELMQEGLDSVPDLW